MRPSSLMPPFSRLGTCTAMSARTGRVSLKSLDAFVPSSVRA
ncbi:hypothetical protein [Actinomadura keratinilytica]